MGQTQHDNGPNLDGKRRWGIISYYCRLWVKPTFDFTQCGPEIYNSLTPQLKNNCLVLTVPPPKSGDERILTMTKIEDLPVDYEETLKMH